MAESTDRNLSNGLLSGIKVVECGEDLLGFGAGGVVGVDIDPADHPIGVDGQRRRHRQAGSAVGVHGGQIEPEAELGLPRFGGAGQHAEVPGRCSVLIRLGIDLADGKQTRTGGTRTPDRSAEKFMIPNEPWCHRPRPSTGRSLEPTGDQRYVARLGEAEAGDPAAGAGERRLPARGAALEPGRSIGKRAADGRPC